MAQHVSLLGGVGMIPTWQFSPNPISFNPHVKFPEGMTQQTVQPVGPYAGLGIPMISPESRPVGIGPTPLRGLGFFESGWWQQRKWIVLGALGILGLGAAALATKVLR